MSRLPAGRTPWMGADAYQSQMSDYLRRQNALMLDRTIGVYTTGTTIAGYRILADETTYTLPLHYVAPITIKNATGSSVTVSPPSGQTIYSVAADQASMTLLDGDSCTYVQSGTVWYVV
jgi:hypothetical protein